MKKLDILAGDNTDMDQKLVKPAQKEEPKKPVVPVYWWNERHLAVVFVLGLAVTVFFNGW